MATVEPEPFRLAFASDHSSFRRRPVRGQVARPISASTSDKPTFSYRNPSPDTGQQSSFDRFLDYDVDLRVGQVKERSTSRGPVTYEGIQICLHPSGVHDLHLTPIDSEEKLESWLDHTGQSSPEADGGVRMRLLVHFWPEKRPSKSPFPFENESIARNVIANLGLPNTYLYVLARNSYAPFSLHQNEDKDAGHVYCQSPQFANYFTSMALSYKLSSKSVSGFLCLESSQSALFFHLQQLNAYIAHPLLLPVLIFRQRADLHQTRSRMANNMMDSVQSGTGLLHSSFFFAPDVVKADSSEIEDDTTADRLHETIVNAHGHLTHGAMYFLDDLAEGIRRHFDDIENPLTADELASLRTLFDITSNEAQIALSHKETLIARMNVQLQALYNIMQQNAMKQARRDVKITMKDSARMKAIALLTMVFLPSTTLATIFSMSAFFSTNADGTITVLPTFWIFWAISIPVTLLVLTCYVVWIRRIDKTRM